MRFLFFWGGDRLQVAETLQCNVCTKLNGYANQHAKCTDVALQRLHSRRIADECANCRDVAMQRLYQINRYVAISL